jgi:hypothetical protein
MTDQPGKIASLSTRAAAEGATEEQGAQKSRLWGSAGLAVAAVLLLALAALSQTKFFVKGVIDYANFCGVDEDCASVGHGVCPIGCYNYVHEAFAGPVGLLLASHVSDCTYKCRACGGVQCKNSRCEPAQCQ